MSNASARAGIAERIAVWLRRRGAPASSASLVELFLKAPAGSEAMATRLLATALEEAGLVYRDGEGWLPPDHARQPPRMVAAVVEPGSGRTVISGDRDLAGAILVLREPKLEGAAAREWLRARRLAQPDGITSLRAAVRGAGRLPRGADLQDICTALGVRWLEGEDAGSILSAMSACLDAAATTNAPPVDPAPEAPLPGRITHAQLAALPESAGTYKFFDTGGGLLYVGKATNLKRRVSSYFKPGAAARRGGHGRRFVDRIDRLEVRLAGSDLEALLREASLIQRHEPPGNVQIAVRERGRRYGEGRTWALLLPSPDGQVTAVVVSRGRCLGTARVGPRGGGMAKLRPLLGRAVCPARGTRRALRPAATDRDTQLLFSWLARHGDEVSRLDLDGFTKAADAANALRVASRGLLKDGHRTVFR